jgi:hypothetical protein
MSRLLEKAEAFAAKPGRLSRRTLVGRLAKVSAGLAFGAAGLDAFRGTSARVAQAAYGWDQCCTLVYPESICSSEYKCTNKCPSGCGEAWTWTCQARNGCTLVCGECYDCKCSFSYKVCTSTCTC